MELSPKQQFIELINSAKSPLILTHQRPDGDALGSMTALFLTLERMGKKVSAVCVDPIPSVFKFLPAINQISTEFKGTRDLLVSIDVNETAPEKIFYKVENNRLNIVITPKNGQFDKEKIVIKDGGFKYDLVIILDSTALERLGLSFEDNPDLFFETPVVNIDHHSGNDHFGKVNIIDLTATSTAEILVSLIEALGQKFDAEVATALLCGITTDTGSFQNANTTPKSLTVAAQLVAAGGRQQEIIRHIYKTRSITTLKLWGIVLSKMRLEESEQFIWSSLSTTDFTDAGANEDESAGVIDELLKTASGAKFALLLSERNNGVHGSLRSIAKGVDVSAIASIFNGGGHLAAAAFQVDNTNLGQESARIIKKIKDFINGNGNNHQSDSHFNETKLEPLEPVVQLKTPNESELSPEESSSEITNHESPPKW